MSPYMKGALGFLGCAAICKVVYELGKRKGKQEVIDDIERQTEQEQQEDSESKETEVNNETRQVVVDGKVEKVRRMHGIKSTLFGGGRVIKDLLKNPDGKQLTVTVEDGDVVARISSK